MSSGFVQIVDQRPDEERRFRASSGEPVWLYGDAEFSPARLVVLKSKLDRALGDRSRGVAVVLQRFEVINNFKASADKGRKVMWFAALGGIVGGVAAAALGDERADGNHIGCTIEGHANGIRFGARYTQAYNMSGSWTTTAFNDPVVGKTVGQVVDRCTDLAAQEVVTKLAAAPAAVKARGAASLSSPPRPDPPVPILRPGSP